MHRPPLALAPLLHSSLAVVCILLGAAACTDSTSPPPADRPSPPVTDARPAQVYECASSSPSSFHVSFSEEETQRRVILPGRFAPQSRIVRRVPSASGAKFEGSDLLVWTKGAEAIVDVNGQSFRNCLRVVSPPPADSVLSPTFRALGQEPGWLLTIFPDRLWFVGNYGRRPLAFPRSEPMGDSTSFRTTYQAKTRAHTLRVVLRDTSCSDTMSGEKFSYGVSVTLNDTTYTGCGDPLS